MTRIELLAPARDPETGIAAINCGADAVYIGASRFGAREAAGNSEKNLERLITHAHQYWARVYVTLNTLLRDDELPDAVKLAWQVYEQGADGLIIQDTGLLESDLPPLPIIASTQMHNDSVEKVAFLESVGFQRVILARELSLEEIRRIREKTSIELEFFIHGALCVSYSGQCYMSYAIGGRSGNRGQCAQPCRRLYDLVNSKGEAVVSRRHLLSLKDLNLSDHLRDLIDAGISSFKIEGRLKDPTYVMNVVSHYRKKIDSILEGLEEKKSSSGTSSTSFTPDPDRTFNRRFTTYFINGRDPEMGSIETPKQVGEPIGTVHSVGPGHFIIRSAKPLHSGDGISFFDRRRILQGTTINRVDGDRIFPENMHAIEKGGTIYRNHDHVFLSAVRNSNPQRRIDVELTISETGDGLKVEAVDEDSIRAEYSLACPKPAALKPESATQNIDRQLRKTGDTQYCCMDVKILLDRVCFVPVSLLNALRRGVLERLTIERERARPKSCGRTTLCDSPYPVTRLTFLGNVLNRNAEAFYRRHGVTDIEPAAESGLDMTGRKVMTTRYCILDQLGLCRKKDAPVKLTGTQYLEDENGHRYELRFDCRTCRMEIYY